MPRSSAQSDFVFSPGEPDPEDVELPLPPGADPIALPKATVRTRFASATATKWVMGFTFAILAILILMTVIGPHIPSGE